MARPYTRRRIYALHATAHMHRHQADDSLLPNPRSATTVMCSLVRTPKNRHHHQHKPPLPESARLHTPARAAVSTLYCRIRRGPCRAFALAPCRWGVHAAAAPAASHAGCIQPALHHQRLTLPTQLLHGLRAVMTKADAALWSAGCVGTTATCAGIAPVPHARLSPPRAAGPTAGDCRSAAGWGRRRRRPAAAPPAAGAPRCRAATHCRHPQPPLHHRLMFLCRRSAALRLPVATAQAGCDRSQCWQRSDGCAQQSLQQAGWQGAARCALRPEAARTLGPACRGRVPLAACRHDSGAAGADGWGRPAAAVATQE